MQADLGLEHALRVRGRVRRLLVTAGRQRAGASAGLADRIGRPAHRSEKMKQLSAVLVCLLMFCALSQASEHLVSRAAKSPAAKKAAKVVEFPVVHPVKSAKGLERATAAVLKFIF